ncbi:hypothetical protein [Streptomyces sp. NPDC094149]|uniref:hypothetical protein n=1 Tax=Streptomyces sp. NPDC094149 TaxID=3155079 RepID=UPI003330C1F0
MARLQILQLPEGANDEQPPFILVVDQYVPQRYILGADQPEPVNELDGIAEKIGARAVLAFEETVDIPANSGADGAAKGVKHGSDQQFVLNVGDKDFGEVLRAALSRAQAGRRS